VGHQLRGSTADRLRSLFALFFAFETRRKRLFLAHIAATYDWRPNGLARGVVAGDVDPTVDQEVVVDCLLAAYAWTYRLAAWDDADADAMSRAMDYQIGLLAKGFTPRAQVSALI
jgi:hypothetical protein